MVERMSRNVFVIGVVCILLAIPHLFIPMVNANPIPVSESGVAPIIDVDTPIRFKSESITYTIDEAHEAKVEARYIFQNPTDRPINLTIFLPFLYSGIPDDLSIREDNISATLQQGNESYPVISVPIPFKHVEFDVYHCAAFNLSIDENETKGVNATYTLWLAEQTHYLVTDKCYCTYIAETGSYWNYSIEKAEFTFKIDKALYSFGLSGFSKKDRDGYIIASKTFANWTADSNIRAEWYKINTFGKLSIIVVVVTLIVMTVVLIRKNEKRR